MTKFLLNFRKKLCAEEISESLEEDRSLISIADVEEEILNNACKCEEFIPVKETPVLYLSFSFNLQEFARFKDLAEVERIFQEEIGKTKDFSISGKARD